MGDLVKNISRDEAACKCGCGMDAADFELVNAIQECCDHFAGVLSVEKVYLGITSWNRCDYWNGHEGGEKDSKHPDSKGVDFWIRGVHADNVADYLEEKYPGRYGVGRYKGRTHFDIAAGPERRWGKREL